MSSSFWEFLWLIMSGFFLLAYLTVMFQIVVDLFRDSSMGGFAKVVWIIFLIILPLVTALVYIIARGGGMGERRWQQERQFKEETDAYIRNVAGISPADEIGRAKSLLKDGTITESEFAAIKAKALA